jgi:hypothetical protein
MYLLASPCLPTHIRNSKPLNSFSWNIIWILLKLAHTFQFPLKSGNSNTNITRTSSHLLCNTPNVIGLGNHSNKSCRGNKKYTFLWKFSFPICLLVFHISKKKKWDNAQQLLCRCWPALPDLFHLTQGPQLTLYSPPNCNPVTPRRSMKLTIHLHLVRTVRKCGAAYSPSYVFMIWRLIKHRDKFTFLYPWANNHTNDMRRHI